LLKVGTVVLHRCDTGAPWCGYLTRPFGAGTISIYFEFYPHTGEGKATGTLVATEGGPGYPATESRDEYLELFRSLRGTRDVVLMDNRGTGRSGALDCRPLQTDPVLTEANIGCCGRSLGAKAGLYSSVLAADDLAAILDALGSGPIDLYGDSYGTFFEQVFAVRHSGKLRSIILDGAYPLDGPDYAWYPNYAPAMRDKFDLACERSIGCSRLLGSGTHRRSRGRPDGRRPGGLDRDVEGALDGGSSEGAGAGTRNARKEHGRGRRSSALIGTKRRRGGQRATSRLGWRRRLGPVTAPAEVLRLDRQ
jgi:pimeloyl-ACP methyl ester carboxylesterase